MRYLPWILLGLLASAGIVHADVVNIGWGDAPSSGGASNLLFDCDRNTGSNTFVVSFVPDMDMHGVTYMEAQVRIVMGEIAACCSGGGYYPPRLAPWWNFQAGTARAGALAASTNIDAEPWVSSTTIESPFSGWSSGVSYSVEKTANPPYAYPDTSEIGIIDVAAVLPPGTSVDLLAGHEYYIAHGAILNAHTVGAGAVDGCCSAAQLTAEVYLTQTDVPFLERFVSASIAWNGWRYSSPCGVTPVHASTWGALKSKYR
jgi:hypothetical protein